MKTIDIVILSYAKTQFHYQLTVNCLKSLLNSKLSNCFNIIVVESERGINFAEFPEVKTVHFDEEFNYNRFANLALKNTTSELIGVFNNDVIFSENWFVEIIRLTETETSFSCSPISLTSASQREYINSKYTIQGYGIAREISGWAIVLNRLAYNKIGGFGESYSFWCSDDEYSRQLKNSDINHFLIPTSIVNHIEQGSNTLKTLPEDLKKVLTYEQAKVWNKNNNDNKFGLNGK